MIQLKESIVWHHVDDVLPDADKMVLVSHPDMEEGCWPGYLDQDVDLYGGMSWYAAGGDRFAPQPTLWAEMPRGAVTKEMVTA